MYKLIIDHKIVEEQFKHWFGDDFKLLPKIQYQAEIGGTKVDIIFTKDKRALWIMKHKGKYYGNAMKEVHKGDGFYYVDIYQNFVENAKQTLKELKK